MISTHGSTFIIPHSSVILHLPVDHHSSLIIHHSSFIHQSSLPKHIIPHTPSTSIQHRWIRTRTRTRTRTQRCPLRGIVSQTRPSVLLINPRLSSQRERERALGAQRMSTEHCCPAQATVSRKCKNRLCRERMERGELMKVTTRRRPRHIEESELL